MSVSSTSRSAPSRIATWAARKSLSPKRDLVRGGGVVLVDHRHHAPAEQRLERVPGVQVVAPRRHVEEREQHLRAAHAARLQQLVVGAVELSLPHGRGRLEVLHRGRAASAGSISAMPRAIAPGGDDHHVVAGLVARGHLPRTPRRARPRAPRRSRRRRCSSPASPPRWPRAGYLAARAAGELPVAVLLLELELARLALARAPAAPPTRGPCRRRPWSGGCSTSASRRPFTASSCCLHVSVSPSLAPVDSAMNLGLSSSSQSLSESRSLVASTKSRTTCSGRRPSLPPPPPRAERQRGEREQGWPARPEHRRDFYRNGRTGMELEHDAGDLHVVPGLEALRPRAP